MKKLVLHRVTCDDECTTGVLIYDYRAFCVTLENPWLGNKSNVSCIPAGNYFCKRFLSPARGYEVYQLQDVPGRSSIQVHKGNTAEDTSGCILVGERFEPLDKRQAVIYSQAAWDELNRIIAGDDGFWLHVKGVQL